MAAPQKPVQQSTQPTPHLLVVTIDRLPNGHVTVNGIDSPSLAQARLVVLDLLSRLK